MTTTPTSTNHRRFGSRLSSLARALLTVSALAALAVSTARADVVFTRSTQTNEHWAAYSATFTPAYSGNYTLGFNLTAGGPSGDNSILIDAVKVTNGATTVFADGFETPSLATNTGLSANGGTATIGNWVCTNSSGILDGSPPNWGLAGQGLGSADGTTQYGYLQAVSGTLPNIKASNTLALVAGQTYTVSFYQASRRDFGGTTTYTVTLDAPLPIVYASGISGVTTWDPIFPATVISPADLESRPSGPTVGPGANWVNPHAAFVFPDHTHPWAPLGGSSPYNFDARWINYGSSILSQGPGGESWSKYSLPVFGEGQFVLQFLADNVSWIYIDGALVGFQGWNWQTDGTGRYTINLVGAGQHELSFIIWDGGGDAGGKFRLETVASFLANNPGATLPPAPATVTLSNLSQTYDGTPKAATVSVSPGGLTTSVTYNGSTTAPTNAGSYTVVATVTSPGYLGSATGTLTIGKAPVTFTLGNLTQTYDATAKSVTAAPTPAGVAFVINYLGDRTNAGDCPVQAVSNSSNYTGSTSGTLHIDKANATVTVNGYTGTYDATAHGATGSAMGFGGANLSAALSLGATFTNAPGGTATWSFAGGANYNNASGTAAIVINKADATITVTGYTGIYDAAAHGATGSATGIGGVDLGAGLTLGSSFTNAPGGTTNWSFAGGTNYNDASGSAAIVINKATATVTVNGYTGIFDAAAHSATGTATGVGGASLGGLDLGASFTSAPGGTAHWAFAGGTNYTDQSGDVAIVIAKANASVAVTGYTGVYDGAAHGASGTASGVGGANLSGSLNLGATFANTPGGTAHWTFTGGTNYNDQSGDVAIVINKANPTVAVTPYSLTYDGAAHSATATITGVNGESGATVGVITLNSTHTNAGTYSDSWSFAGASNYNSLPSTAITDAIAKANATVVIKPYNVEYDGLSHSATVTSITGVSGQSGATVGTVTLNSTHTAVGTYTADSWTFAGTANYNSIAATLITDVIKDTTPPTLTATMTARGGGDDESSQFFTVAFSATDLVGVKTLTAVLNGVTVTNGQVVQLQTIKSGAQTVKRDDGKLQIKATSFALIVTASDAAGNVSTKTIVPMFVKNGKDDEDKKGGDDKGKGDDDKGKGDDDKKGGDDKGRDK